MWKLLQHTSHLPYRSFSWPSSPIKNNVLLKQYNIFKKNITFKPQYKRPESNVIKKIPLIYKVGLGLTTASLIHVSSIKFVFCEQNIKTRVKDYKLPAESKQLKFDWKRFWSYLPQMWLIALAIGSALIVAILNIEIPQMMSSIINIIVRYTAGTANSKTFLDDIKAPAARLVGLYIAQSAFTFVYIFLLSVIGEHIAHKMKTDLFKSIIAQDIAFFDAHATGEIVNRLTVDVQDFKSSFKQTISTGLRAITQIIGSGVTIFMISPVMTGMTLLIIPSIIIIGTGFGTVLRKRSREAQAQSEKTTAVAEEAISNIRTVRAFAMEDQEIIMFSAESELIKKLNISLGVGIGLFQAGTNLFLNGMVLGTISMGGYLLSTNQLSAGELMTFLMATQTIQRSLAQLSLLFGSVIRGLAAGARVFEYINLEPTLYLKGGKKLTSDEVIGNISFKDVTFAYPTRPDVTVLNSLNLDVKSGQTVALVGASGNGKSTVIALLERFYDVNNGSVIIDGHDIRELDSTWLRQHVIGLVSQEPILFGCTVRENIRYGKMDASDAEIEEAAKLANAHDFIIGFPNGYDTMVGERGSALSGGQKQRVAIARALLKNPTILLLDEATSALDSESEKLVQKALDMASVGRTCVVIAHRLSTVQNADLIVVLDKGKVVEMGTHQELIKKHGIYWTLCLQQQLEEGKN